MKLDITFRKKSDELMTSWEIGNFLDKFGSYYYKISIMEELKSRIKGGVSANDIFILSKSFKLHNKYYKLGVDNGKTIRHMYAIGLPIALYPNKKMKRLELIFKYFRHCNEILNSKRVQKLPLLELEKLYEQSKHIDDIEEILNIIYQRVQTRYSDKTETRVIEEVNKNIVKYINTLVSEYTEFIVDEKECIRIQNKLDNNNFCIETLKDDQKKFYEKYFERFFYYFEEVSRPIIGIYKDDLIEILGNEHINKNKRDESFLDVKRVSHNSPPEFNLITEVINGGKTIHDTIKDEKRKQEKHVLEMREKYNELELQQLTIQDRTEENEYRSATRKLQVLDKVLTLCENHGIEGEERERLINNFLGERIEATIQHTQANTRQLLQYNGLNISSIDIHHMIDQRV